MGHVLDGVTVPLVTQLDEHGLPDAGASAQHMELLAASGADTILVLGTNGEGPTLSADLAVPFAVDVAAHWRSALPGGRVLVAAFGVGTAQTVSNGEQLLRAEPDALVVAPPLYFHHTDAELVRHYEEAGQFGVPVIAYDTPRYSGNSLRPVADALAGMDHMVGVKDSSGDDDTLLEWVRASRNHRGFGVSQGKESRLSWALKSGAYGITPGLANIAPRSCVELFRAVRTGSHDVAEALQHSLDALLSIHAIRPGVAAMKASVALLALGSNRTMKPFVPYSGPELERLHKVLDQHVLKLIAPVR